MRKFPMMKNKNLINVKMRIIYLIGLKKSLIIYFKNKNANKNKLMINKIQIKINQMKPPILNKLKL